MHLFPTDIRDPADNLSLLHLELPLQPRLRAADDVQVQYITVHYSTVQYSTGQLMMFRIALVAAGFFVGFPLLALKGPLGAELIAG